MSTSSYLAHRPLWISHIHQQIFAFQIKMYNVLSMQILHPKCRIHSYDKSLTTINSPVQLHYELTLQLSKDSLDKLEQKIKNKK